MFYLFKRDFMGNNIPVYAAQTDEAATQFKNNSRDQLSCTWVPGNRRTLIGL